MSHRITNWVGLFVAVAAVGTVNLIPALAQAQITFLNTWGSAGTGNNQFFEPTSVAVGSTGTVYVSDDENQRVQVFNSSGVYQSTIGGSEGPGNNQFDAPEGVAVGPTGTIYVADELNDRVQVFNSAGIYQSTLGTTGSEGQGNNQFNGPVGVAVVSTGTIYVGDSGNGRVQVFNSSGVYQSTIGSSIGTGNNQFDGGLEGVAVGPTGTVYVADTQNDRVQVFNSTGVYQSTIGTTGSAGPSNNQFDIPVGVAVGPTGTVYVADLVNDRVQVFNSAGIYQSTLGTGSAGTGNNQFDFPSGVAVATTGMVYVADAGNNRIVRYFDPASWVSGTNTFTDPTVGPTSVTVGTGQLMGTSLTLTSAMGLVVGSAVTVNSGGILTIAGGSITAPAGIGVNQGGSIIYQGGSLDIGEISVAGFFQATQGGQLSAPNGTVTGGSNSAEMLLDGGTSLSTETVSMQGGLLVLGNATVSVTNASLPFRIYSGELQLQNANTSVVNTASLQNIAGLVDGSGQINGQLVNYLSAQVSVAAGQTMTITGSGNVNDGLMSLTGGTFHFTQDLTNNASGAIEGYGTLRMDGGLINNGILAVGGAQSANLFGTITNNGSFSLAGSTYVFGTVNNTLNSTIHLSGNTPNIFYGAVSNDGAINIDAGALGLFYGGVTGSGTLTLQLAGDAVGAYSKLDVPGALSLGGTLTVNLVNGFTPALGNNFDLLDWGSLSGHFSSVSLPALSAGLAWDSAQLYTTGTLDVVNVNLLPGDFNRDGHVDASDILPAMKALTDPAGYEAQYSVSAADLQIIGDVNGDTKFTNADLQALLDYLKDGGGSISTVPEPASWILAFMALAMVSGTRFCVRCVS